MKQSIPVIALACAMTCAAIARAQTPPPAPCTPSGGLSFVCGIQNGEDLVLVPNTRWLIASGMAPGSGLHAVDTQAKAARTIYGAGADIIYHASGSTGLGVFQAAEEKKKLAIGVDSDQYKEMPGRVLTSMVKRVDVAVFNTIQDEIQGKFPGGQVHVFDLKQKGVDYVDDANNHAMIPEDVRQKVEALRQEIIAGTITPPSE